MMPPPPPLLLAYFFLARMIFLVCEALSGLQSMMVRRCWPALELPRDRLTLVLYLLELERDLFPILTATAPGGSPVWSLLADIYG